ncbi:FAD-dependent oxidoreductase [Variovorax sp. GT1P44]|uniref:FAD-dependent oxidoreductase n=1 Tax=Variovorax sp. GT1P44 TaxID=3443742 RepID=UPI003F4753BC
MTGRTPKYPLEADVVIVGAGAAGAVMAARLAQAGRRAVVLEAGPRWNAGDLVSSQIWARRIKWGGPAVLPGGEDPYGFNMANGWGVGGASLHHYGGWPRMHPEDFRLHSAYGQGVDWPLTYADLRPWYDKIQEEIGISGDAVAETWRPPGAAYPLGPMAVFSQGALLRRGFEKRGLRTAPYPAAILSASYKGRPACINDGWCDAGCPLMALANPLALYIPQALAAGAVVHEHCRVRRLRADGQGGRVRAVEFVDAKGHAHTVRARAVVLAAGPVQNVRILLQSASAASPKGLANGSGMVGRNIAAHVMVPAHGFFDEETQCHLGTSGAQLICQDHYGKRRAGGPFGSVTWAIANALKPNDLLGIANTRADLFGGELHRFMARAAKHLATMSAICETVPSARNRIELGPGLDRDGIAQVRITHSLDEQCRALAAFAGREALALFAAAGSRENWLGQRGLAHLAGGTIMGEKAAESVTDSFGICHEHANLLIAGAGVFPSLGAVNPTFTLHALASRSAEHVIQQWSNLAA